jgi:putative pyruvate formate lyase activating enzyme
MEVAKHNILEARRDGEVIVRHLVLPGHSECCLRPILRWLAEKAPEVKVSLRGDYVPPAESDSAPVEYVRRQELDSAINLAKEMGLNLIQ